MASPSPTPPSLSPTPHPAHLHTGHQPNTTAPQSKRDKRRHALSEKLTTLTTSFHNPANPRARDTHYRAQLASLQADIQLVTKCDASGRDMRLLDDSSDTIHREVEDALLGMGLTDLVGRDRGNPKDDPSVMGGAGRWYGDFLEKVNQGMEERDAQLTLLYNQYHHKSLSLAAHHTRSIVHAREEHKSLSSTIQQRLMARLKTQLKKLAAEKESSSSTTLSSLNSLSTSAYTDLTETNALLLHPSQFGIVPSMGSPTRRNDDDPTEPRRKPRRRAGEVEELLSFGVGINFDPPSSNGKRKRTTRTLPVPRDEPEEPDTSPSGSVLNFDTPRADPPTTEVTRRRREELMKQVYAPVYSFDKLFTEKELQLAGNQASLATVRYFTERQHMHYGDEDSDADADTPVVDASDREDGNDTDAQGEARYSVNTRSNPPRAAGTREIESLVLGGVPVIGITYVNKANIAPPPPGLRGEDAESDLAAMRRGIEKGSGSSGGGAPVGLGLAGVSGFTGLFGGGIEMSRGESGRGDKRSAGVAGIGGGGDGKKVRRG